MIIQFVLNETHGFIINLRKLSAVRKLINSNGPMQIEKRRSIPYYAHPMEV